MTRGRDQPIKVLDSLERRATAEGGGVNELAKVDAARALIRERPESIRQEQAVADAMIDAAAALGRWDELERAVEIKTAQQQEFVAVWDERVRSQGEARKKIQDENFVSVAEAKTVTALDSRRFRAGARRPRQRRSTTIRQRIIDAATLAAELN